MRKLLKRRSGEGYIDVCVLVVCAMLVLALVEIHLEVPVRFLGNLLPAASMTLHTEAKYVPLF